MFITDASVLASADTGTIMPVVPYSVIWLVLGILLVGAVPLYYLLVYALTRPRPEREPEPVVEVPVSVPQLQHDYLVRVDGIRHRHAAGELTPRRAHAELSSAVRDFVAQATGVEADKMTLTELRRTPYVGASYAVAEFYPLVFGVDEARSVDHGVDAAKQVISLWR
ncbi:hypothetical protein F8O01_08670 [Pseudoclavibacter chungangensis]|uniref:Uncharacterized protein n=1 Tax=Pseudoclavibacter chungangensis TaxID=587635 RepID=A0A7J5BSS9_9MICO|nr:hypothetical protein [Pseudoclavibacter chungangensis]KAB1657306.1 hypothetical protein F8O01_08670 [Pseudoclavibacter chungangensis]NYJ66245.1 hypothetical protein [Pseudoclavibacter chungangensis]